MTSTSNRELDSKVLQVLSKYSPKMQVDELHTLITSVRRAALEDVHSTNTQLFDMQEAVTAEITKRDVRDARLQHMLDAQNVPIDEHMARICRMVDNVNSLHHESFGDSNAYSNGRKLVENTRLYKRFNKNDNSPKPIVPPSDQASSSSIIDEGDESNDLNDDDTSDEDV